MKVRVRRPYLGAEGKTHRGQELEMSEQRFQQLTTGMHAANPLVDPVEIGYKMEPRHKNKMESAPQNKTMLTPARPDRRRTINLDGTEAATGTADPSYSPQTGGQTGAETDASLSGPARQRRASTSAEPAVDAESSPSTTRGGSRRGRKSYTGATSRSGKNTRASRNSKG